MPVDRQRLGAGTVVIAAALAAVCGQLLVPATVSRPDYAEAARALVAGDRDHVIRAPWGYTVPRSLRRRRWGGVKWVVGPCCASLCRSDFGGRPTRKLLGEGRSR